MSRIDVAQDEDATRCGKRFRRGWLTTDGESLSLFTQYVKQPAEVLYHRYFLESLLRQKPLPPSKDGRHVKLQVGSNKLLVDERRGHAYISNYIRSSRYTIWDFLPKQLFFQATRLSNFYFICIGVPQAIPGLSTTGNYTTILPITFFILLTVLKEGYDDYRRYRLDKVENNHLASVLRSKNGLHEATAGQILSRSLSWVTQLAKRLRRAKTTAEEHFEYKELDEDASLAWTRTKWHNIRVGDVLKLKRNEPVPADIVLLYASGENGVAFIETMALDGETNLKTRQAPPPLLRQCRDISQLKNCHADFVLEDPNKDLYDFTGKVTVDGEKLPLTMNEVVFRGSVLRNTDYIIGCCVNTGEECKIRQNANHHPKAKKPRLEKYANQIVLTLILYVVLLSVGLSVGYLRWHAHFESHTWYLKDAAPAFKQIIVGFLIMFNNVIPLALYVSLEIVKIGQRLMVQSDVEMYDEDSNTPMSCNTNTILENLGQVSFVLSDKTGTLTENVMRFRGVSLGGIVWRHGNDNDAAEPEISTDGKGKMDHESRQGQGITIEEREIARTSSYAPSEPRPSHTFSPRRSASRPRLPDTERTTKDLLDLIRREPNSVTGRKAREFIVGLAICHTALPEYKEGQLDFQASSPDELALLRGAQDMGYLLIQRSAQKIELSVPNHVGEQITEVYEILEVVEFSSKRKRMSIVVRCPDGRIRLICKGADSAIIPRLQQSDLATRKSHDVRRSVEIDRQVQRRSEQHEPRNSFGARPSLQIRGRSSLDIRSSMAIGRATLELPRTTSYDGRSSLHADLKRLERLDDSTLFTRCFKHIDEFATEGLRTLLFAHKYLDEEQYSSWKQAYNEATTALVHRQERIEAAAEKIEQGFDLLGASAIEDKLQKGVPETIDRLRRANIRIWMLTGDKRETAINIAHSAQICKPASVISILDCAKGDVQSQMSDVMQEFGHKVVVIDGQTLNLVTASPGLRHYFFTVLIANVDSVIVCRASPSQKADIVRGIRARLPGLTLAIGDGGNDIAMISAAHVGIGISGKEGLQAARVADFSIAQFRYLQRLLLVHGRYHYVRTAKFIVLTFWKEMFFYMMQALFQRYNGYTGSSLYEMWSLT